MFYYCTKKLTIYNSGCVPLPVRVTFKVTEKDSSTSAMIKSTTYIFDVVSIEFANGLVTKGKKINSKLKEEALTALKKESFFVLGE